MRLARELPLRYIALSRNFGKEAGLSAGIDHARGNAVLLIDADFQHPLDLLPQMHALWLSGYDMVYGVIADRAGDSGAKRVGTRAFYRLLNAGNKVKIPPMQATSAGWTAGWSMHSRPCPNATAS